MLSFSKRTVACKTYWKWLLRATTTILQQIIANVHINWPFIMVVEEIPWTKLQQRLSHVLFNSYLSGTNYHFEHMRVTKYLIFIEVTSTCKSIYPKCERNLHPWHCQPILNYPTKTALTYVSNSYKVAIAVLSLGLAIEQRLLST